MIFNSDIFLFVFLPVVFSLFWVARTKRERYLLLTVSGYIFYGYWDWRFCFLLLFSSLVSFFSAIQIEKAATRATARSWMVAAIFVDLALLGFFKYYNFIAVNVSRMLSGSALPLFDIVLPIGISFYTFHTISYIVDVMDGKVRATHDIFEYLTYVSLFSQLVAGPIVRFRQIEADLEHVDRPIQPDFISRGLGFFVIGMVKKVVVADSIARMVNPMLASSDPLSIAGAWLAALGYTFQLYYDFSGYSDMAVGLGYLFGIHIPQNFNSPYRARGIGDFWRRWHISLSSWLRDYLYIRLGGSRGSVLHTNFNLIATMFLGGLWHGANWTFIIWGLYHGSLLILDRTFERTLSKLPVAIYRGMTFVLVVVGWVFFRADNVHSAWRWLGWMVGVGAGSRGGPVSLALLIAVCLIAVNAIGETWDFNLKITRKWAYAFSFMFFVTYLFMNGQESVFLYYQF